MSDTTDKSTVDERIRRWNAFEPMVEALRELVAVIKPLVEIDDNVCYLNGRYAAQVDTRLDQAEAALKLAQETK